MKSQLPGMTQHLIQVVPWFMLLSLSEVYSELLFSSDTLIKKEFKVRKILFIHINGSELGLSKFLFSDFIQIRSPDSFVTVMHILTRVFPPFVPVIIRYPHVSSIRLPDPGSGRKSWPSTQGSFASFTFIWFQVETFPSSLKSSFLQYF